MDLISYLQINTCTLQLNSLTPCLTAFSSFLPFDSECSADLGQKTLVAVPPWMVYWNYGMHCWDPSSNVHNVKLVVWERPLYLLLSPHGGHSKLESSSNFLKERSKNSFLLGTGPERKTKPGKGNQKTFLYLTIVNIPKRVHVFCFYGLASILLDPGRWNFHRIRRPKFPPSSEILGFLNGQESMKSNFYICQFRPLKTAWILPNSVHFPGRLEYQTEYVM